MTQAVRTTTATGTASATLFWPRKMARRHGTNGLASVLNSHGIANASEGFAFTALFVLFSFLKL